MDKISKFIKKAESSHFSRNFYSVDIEFEAFYRSLLVFLNRPLAKKSDEGNVPMEELVSAIYDAVPEFQRNNDKWTREMQSSYVSNIIQGCRSNPLMLYIVGKPNTSKSFCKILDGLQRITAILDFYTRDDFTVFVGDHEYEMKASELLSDKRFEIHTRGLTVNLRVYEFDTEIEAVEYYIAMNENITHSSDDIERAKKYLAKLKG